MTAWGERLLAKIPEPDQKAKHSGSNDMGIKIVFRASPGFRTLLDLARGKRGLSLAGYIRRSVSRQIAEDLSLPYLDVLKETPHPAPQGRRYAPALNTWERRRGGRDPRPMIPDDGTGYGEWPWTT